MRAARRPDFWRNIAGTTRTPRSRRPPSFFGSAWRPPQFQRVTSRRRKLRNGDWRRNVRPRGGVAAPFTHAKCGCGCLGYLSACPRWALVPWAGRKTKEGRMAQLYNAFLFASAIDLFQRSAVTRCCALRFPGPLTGRGISRMVNWIDDGGGRPSRLATGRYTYCYVTASDPSLRIEVVRAPDIHRVR